MGKTRMEKAMEKGKMEKARVRMERARVRTEKAMEKARARTGRTTGGATAGAPLPRGTAGARRRPRLRGTAGARRLIRGTRRVVLQAGQLQRRRTATTSPRAAPVPV